MSDYNLSWPRIIRMVLAGILSDRRMIAPAGVEVKRHAIRGLILSPPLRAAALMRISASRGGVSGALCRNLLLTLHSCDVTPGARIGGALHVPHPVGIVLGSGAIVGDGVTIYQHVTVGASRSGKYPIIGDGVVLFPASLVAGGVVVGDGAIIGAGVQVHTDVPANAVVRS